MPEKKRKVSPISERIALDTIRKNPRTMELLAEQEKADNKAMIDFVKSTEKNHAAFISKVFENQFGDLKATDEGVDNDDSGCGDGGCVL